MQITVNEALKLKNEIFQLINQIQRDLNNSEFGELVENEHKQNTGENKFPDVLLRFYKILKISEEVNSRLARFDIESGISDAVRTKKNLEVLVSILERNLPNCTPYDKMVRNPYSNEPAIHKVFTPYTTKAEIKKTIKDYKKTIRDIDSQIYKANSAEIVFNFEYEDLE